eukprot:9202576-Pyramimonas_sp.AAC.2
MAYLLHRCQCRCPPGFATPPCSQKRPPLRNKHAACRGSARAREFEAAGEGELGSDCRPPQIGVTIIVIGWPERGADRCVTVCAEVPPVFIILGSAIPTLVVVSNYQEGVAISGLAGQRCLHLYGEIDFARGKVQGQIRPRLPSRPGAWSAARVCEHDRGGHLLPLVRPREQLARRPALLALLHAGRQPQAGRERETHQHGAHAACRHDERIYDVGRVYCQSLIA